MMKRLHAVSVLVSALLITLITMTGCSSGSGEGPRVFRYRLESDPPTLDPIHTTDTSSASVVFRMFEGLVNQDPETLEIIPGLAENWEISNDGLCILFT